MLEEVVELKDELTSIYSGEHQPLDLESVATKLSVLSAKEVLRSAILQEHLKYAVDFVWSAVTVYKLDPTLNWKISVNAALSVLEQYVRSDPQ